MAENVKIKLTAQDETKGAFDSVNNNLKKTDKAAKGMKKSFAVAGGATRQMGYQIQDVAVQLGAGQNAMMVLGQQGSQIASIFGPGGAVVGAVLAVASAIGGALLPELFRGNKALEDMDENIKNLRGTLAAGFVSGQDMSALVNALSIKEAEAVTAFEGARNTLIELQQIQRGGVTKEKSLVKELMDTMFGDDPEELDRQIAAQELAVGKARAILNAIRDDLANAKKQQEISGFMGEYIPLLELQSMAEDAAKKLERYNDAQDKTAEVIKRSIDPMYAHLENIKKLNILREEGRLTEVEYAKAVIKSGNAVSQNAVKEIEAKKKQKDEAVKTAFDGFNALATHNKKVSKMMKVANVSRAIMDTYAGANKALATYPPPWNFAMAAGVVAAGMANVATIRSQRRFGGTVNAGEPYTVGEQGQETFVPQSAGRIEPNGGGRAVNFNVTTVDARGFDELLQSRRGMIVSMVNRAMNDRGRVGVTA